uniref:Uncharacterized protein n=1 Tax=Strongyloides papillosus TaxID=174720 RepID=A0A0N5BHJ2_STREA
MTSRKKCSIERVKRSFGQKIKFTTPQKDKINHDERKWYKTKPLTQRIKRVKYSKKKRNGRLLGIVDSGGETFVCHCMTEQQIFLSIDFNTEKAMLDFILSFHLSLVMATSTRISFVTVMILWTDSTFIIDTAQLRQFWC